MVSYEQNPNTDIVAAVMRTIHSQKGSAHSVEWGDIASQLHKIESDLKGLVRIAEQGQAVDVSNILSQLDAIQSHVDSLKGAA